MKIISWRCFDTSRLAAGLFIFVDAIEQAGEHANLIGLFLLVTACYGQSADFFWV